MTIFWTRIRQLDSLEETHVRTVSRLWTGYLNFCPRFHELRRDSDAAELRDSVRLADVFSSPAVLVDGVDVEVAVRFLASYSFTVPEMLTLLLRSKCGAKL